MKSASENVLRAIAVTAELTNTVLSEAAARVMASDLADYPEEQILPALTRCRKELRGRLTISEVLTRLEDGRPGAEEAWAYHVPKDEAATVVWTDEIRDAWGIALPLLKAEDEIPARMAFKERYQQAVQRARDEKRPVKWSVSIGTDVVGRESVLTQAVERGRITAKHAAALLPAHQVGENPRLALLLASATGGKLLEQR